MKSTSASVIVTWNGSTYRANKGSKLSDCLGMEQPCGGHGVCGKCKVIVKGSVSPLSETEHKRLSHEEIGHGVRLACCTYVEGDCEVASLLSSFAPTENRIITDSTMPEFVCEPTFSHYGVALDIGTTTLAARLYDANGSMLSETSRLNPQSVLGADVISRIEASMQGEAHRLASLICTAIDEMLLQLADGAGISVQDIDGMVFTGNTAMLYLLTGSSPESLSQAPFEADRLFGESLAAGEIGLLSVIPDTQVYLPPCIAAFLGADIACALLATQFCQSQETVLIADIGTNGEMALWHNGDLLLCSTAAGPAFEGVGISMGMRGATGAVDRVCLKDGNLHSHVIGEGTPLGICGSGLVDATACLLEQGVLDEAGFLEEDPVTISEPVVITGQDIRMIQLAKSAICAGLQTLLKEEDISCESVASLYIAGGFGNYLNMEHAGKIGLVPGELVDKIHVVGNAALGGACMLLLSRSYRAECAEMVGRARLVELSSNPVFSERFMMGMMF